MNAKWDSDAVRSVDIGGVPWFLAGFMALGKGAVPSIDIHNARATNVPYGETLAILAVTRRKRRNAADA